jgi:predicted PurR-regulated permease PerM
MPVILIGAIGGLILYGLIGLFVGAVVLAVGYEMFQAWMGEDGAGEPGAPSDVASEATEPA